LVRRRRRAAGLALCLISGLGASPAWGQQKPNIIFLLSDDAGYADFGFQSEFSGRPTEFKTPNLDALAERSVRFSQAYSAGAVCAPSRAGVLTGQYQQRLGVDYNIGSDYYNPNDGLPADATLIFEAMKTAGYSTGVVGKWHLGVPLDKQPQNQGVDEFFGILDGGGPYFGPDQFVLRNTTRVDWRSEPSFNNIPVDPTYGRMITDAHGDEASRFVSAHAHDSNPFFLYTAFTAPHSPYDKAKADDVAQFDGTSLTGLRKNAAALTYAMDRAIGNILARVNDPDGNPSTNDSIADNTVIVFANDNGGNFPWDPQSQGQDVHSNGPLRDYKGAMMEGGIRVPMMVHVPGLAPGVFNQVASALDLVPTFENLAGVADPGTLDGNDLMPYLTGHKAGPANDELFWRLGVNGFAVRKGDWKLVRNRFSTPQLFHMSDATPVVDGAGETVDLSAAEPARFQELLNDYVDWEVGMRKSESTSLFAYFNRFDAFRWRTDAGVNMNWRDGGAWRDDAAPGAPVTMAREDSYANAVLVFSPRNDASYTSTNNMSRSAGVDPGYLNSYPNPPGLAEYMLNQLRLSGDFSGDADQSATLAGYPLMFTNSLSGGTPQIVCDATAAVANKFTYNVNMDLVLHDSLEITGDGTQNFSINGQLRDFRHPATVTKSGGCVVTLTGNNTFTGETQVNGGVLRIEGAAAALGNTAKVQVGAGGTLNLASGRIRTPVLQLDEGGALNFTGGILETLHVVGDLANNGGSFRPGPSTAIVDVSGDFVQNSGVTVIEIGGLIAGEQFDQITADHVSLAGRLRLSFIDSYTPAVGDVFEILKTANGVAGAFDSLSLPSLLTSVRCQVEYGANSVFLRFVDGPTNDLTHLSADFNDSDTVDSLDFKEWQANWGQAGFGDADDDGDTDGRDFLAWQRQFGMRAQGASTILADAAPEPDMAWEALLAGVAAVLAKAGASSTTASEMRPAGAPPRR
jgi:autotransporter-associated beta strand protein